YSSHGDQTTKPASELPFENGHLKIVYHKDGILTHAFRFAKTNEYAENPYGAFVAFSLLLRLKIKFFAWRVPRWARPAIIVNKRHFLLSCQFSTVIKLGILTALC
ncbi:MAG: NPP1 family protein, partial [Oleiphilaceae bacterium]|nr:NPP1 family protein [Oleiphilaceae bacterium]